MEKKKIPTDKNIIFYRWSRKVYGIFNSIHRVVNIGVLSTSCFLTILNTNTNAQTNQEIDTSKIHTLDEVEIAGTIPTAIESQETRIVSVINREEIQSLSSSSIDDLLEYALNVDIRSRGKKGTQSDISIRGGSFDQTMILLNGINITDPQTGHHNLVIPIPLDAIQRIEVLSGPGAIKWGSNAFSGAINIVTDTEGEMLDIALSAGQYKLYNGQLKTHFSSGKVNNLISLSISGSDGYTKNTDFKNRSIFYQGSYKNKDGSTEWQVGRTQRAYGASTFYSPSYPDQYEKETVSLVSIKWTGGSKIKLIPAIYYRRNRSQFELFRNGTDAPSWYTEPNYHLNEVFGSNIMASYLNLWGLSQIGATMRNESILSNTLGNSMDENIPIKNTDSSFYTKSYSRTNLSCFLEHRISWNNFYAVGTIALNHNSALPTNWDFFPGLELSYQINRVLKSYTTLNRSMRMPTFTDLFYSGPSNIGNPFLKPETAMTYEGGIKYNGINGITGHLSSFYRQSHNLIDWTKEKPEDKWTSVNHANVNTFGAEISTKLNIKQAFAIDFFIKSLSFGYSYLNSQEEQSINISNYELAYLKHKFNTQITHKIYSSLIAVWNISYQDRNGKYEKYVGSTFIENADYMPFWLTDLKIIWKRKQYELFMNASNLFNTQYNDIGSITQPGRWVSAGIKIKLANLRDRQAF